MFRVRFQFNPVHRHCQHRVVTDTGRQLHILVGPQPRHDRPRQRFVDPVLAQQLLQACVRAPRPVITRAEFTGRRFTYAVEVDTSDGFELCPADVCAIGEMACPAGEEAGRPTHKFTVVDSVDSGFISRLEVFLEQAGVDVAGIEFIVGGDRQPLVYDVNTNTNYNSDAEVRAGIAGTRRSGMGALAAYLGDRLAETRSRAA